MHNKAHFFDKIKAKSKNKKLPIIFFWVFYLFIWRKMADQMYMTCLRVYLLFSIKNNIYIFLKFLDTIFMINYAAIDFYFIKKSFRFAKSFRPFWVCYITLQHVYFSWRIDLRPFSKKIMNELWCAKFNIKCQNPI